MKAKKLFGIVALAAVAALSAGFGVANVTADAVVDWENDFTISQTSIRLGTGEADDPTGIRFYVNSPVDYSAGGADCYATFSLTTAAGASWTTNVPATVWRPDGSGWNAVLLGIPSSDYLTNVTVTAYATVGDKTYHTSSAVANIAEVAATVMQTNGITDNATLNAFTAAAVTSVELDQSAVTLQVEETVPLTATTDNDAFGVVWKSDNEDVATVDANGMVTAVATGTANVTASMGGKTATCAVTVEEEQQVEYEDAVVATFTMGDDNTLKSNSEASQDKAWSEENGDYTLTMTDTSKVYPGCYDKNGNAVIKLGSGSAAGKFSFTVPDNVTKVMLYVAGRQTASGKISVNGGEVQTLTNTSDSGNYDAIEVDTTSDKTVDFTTSSGGYRCYLNTIEFIAQGEKVDFDVKVENVKAALTNPFAEVYSENTPVTVPVTETQYNGTLTWTSTNEDVAAVDGNKVTITQPLDDDATVTLSATYKHGDDVAENIVSYTFDVLKVSDQQKVDAEAVAIEVEPISLTAVGAEEPLSVEPTMYEDVTIAWSILAGNEDNYISLEQPVAGGDYVVKALKLPEGSTVVTITLQATCSLGEVVNQVESAVTTIEVKQDGVQQPYTATLDFTNAANRTASSTTQQVWEGENGLVLTYNKAGYTSNLAEYAPARFYKGTTITIDSVGMTQIVFTCTSSSYATALGNSIGTTATVSGSTVTVSLASAVDSITFTMGAQTRVNTMVVSGNK